MKKLTLEKAQEKIKKMVKDKFNNNKSAAARSFGCSPSMVSHVINGAQPLTSPMEEAIGVAGMKVVEKKIYYKIG